MSASPGLRIGRRFLAGIVLVTSVTACDDPFSPYWDHGTYDLWSANNRPIPAVISEGPAGSFTKVVGGSLTLRRDHSYQLLLDVREATGGRTYEYAKVFAGTYENEDRTIYLIPQSLFNGSMSLDRVTETALQHRRRDLPFGEKIRSPGLHRLHVEGVIALTGHQNDRDLAAFRSHLAE